MTMVVDTIHTIQQGQGIEPPTFYPQFFRGMLYGTVMISAIFFYDIIFLLKRII